MGTRLFWDVVRCLTLSLLLCCTFAQANVLTLSQAQAVVMVEDQTRIEPVTLPYHWDRLHPGVAGQVVFSLRFDLPSAPDTPWGLFIARLGNAYEINLNGSVLQSRGDLVVGSGADFAKEPRFISIQDGLLEKDNLIRISIRTDVGRRGGLAPLVLGPIDEVEELFLSEYYRRSTGSMVVVILSLFVGVVALALWATQVDVDGAGKMHRDPLYLLAAAAELCWAARVGDALVSTPPLSWPWWNMLMVLALAGWCASMGLFCVHIANWQTSRSANSFKLGLVLLVLLGAPVGWFAIAGGKPFLLTLYYAAFNLVFIGFMLFFIARSFKRALLAQRAVAVAAAINTVVGFRDIYAFRVSPSYVENSLTRYSSVLFGLTLLLIVIWRFRDVHVKARDLLVSMASQIAQKEQSLKDSYERMAQVSREQERSNERARILRDMHDGVGSHISSAIRQLESGLATSVDVLHTLRDSLDQLKLSIDAMNFPAGDLTALLASMRYRLEPRFNACGLALQWDVDMLEPLAGLDADDMRHLQFMVFEAISNVLQHARASVLRIDLHNLAGGGACLRIVDNGCGFSPKSVKPAGLDSLRERAKLIGAELSIQSNPGITSVEIVFKKAQAG